MSRAPVRNGDAPLHRHRGLDAAAATSSAPRATATRSASTGGVVREAFAAHGGVRGRLRRATRSSSPSPRRRRRSRRSARRRRRSRPGRSGCGWACTPGEPLLDPPKYVGRDVHRAARIDERRPRRPGAALAATRELRRRRRGARPRRAPVEGLRRAGARSSSSATERFPPLKTISNTNLPRAGVARSSAASRRSPRSSRCCATARASSRSPGRAAPARRGSRSRPRRELVRPSSPHGVFWVRARTAARPGARRSRRSRRRSVRRTDSPSTSPSESCCSLLDNFEQVVEAAHRARRRCSRPARTSRCSSPAASCCASAVRSSTRCRRSREPEAVELFCARARRRSRPTAIVRALRAARQPAARARARRRARRACSRRAQILERLAQRLDLFSGGRDADPRQQTLRATIDWSLRPARRGRAGALRAARASSRGGCTLEAAEEVCERRPRHARSRSSTRASSAAPASASGCSRRSASSRPSSSPTRGAAEAARRGHPGWCLRSRRGSTRSRR